MKEENKPQDDNSAVSRLFKIIGDGTAKTGGVKKMEREDNVLRLDLDNVEQITREELGTDTSVLLYRFIRLVGLRGILGESFSSFSYYGGKRLGIKLPIRSIREMIEFIEKLKLGRMEVVEFDDEKMLVNLYESATCAGLLPVGRPICYFEAGIIAGIAENIFKKRMSVKETKCWGLGDKYCQFQAVGTINKIELGKEYLKEPHFLNKFIEEAGIDYSEENIQLLSTLTAHTIVALENTQLYEQAKKSMIIDAMTNVYNFGYFQNRIKEEFDRAERHSIPLSVMLIDVDYFKKYNDSHGHPEGDALLAELVKVVKANIRNIDILCRYGGDEFVVILPQLEESKVKPMAERIVRRIDSHFFIRGNEKRKISVSLGVSNYPKNASSVVELIKNADAALYQAKNKGRNCYVIYS
ncbi:MAG: DUF2507 domain-containing protein [bacterium]